MAARRQVGDGRANGFLEQRLVGAGIDTLLEALRGQLSELEALGDPVMGAGGLRSM